ncbi:hypothetical protein Tco_1473935 [Tanacetum coccineum]
MFLTLLVDLLLFDQEIRMILMMMLILRGENSAKRQKTFEHETYVFGESSSGQADESEPGLSTSGNQEQLDDFVFWTDTYATDDDELPAEKVSQELVEEMSETVDEAKLRKVVDEIKEILSLPFPQKPILVVQSCKRDPKAPSLSLVNQDLKNFQIGKPIKEVYLNSKIVQVIKTYGELGHEHKFVTEIIVRRANGSIVSVIEPDYKNLNKNDIENMYLLCVNGKLGVESCQQKVNLTAPTITFPRIKKYKIRVLERLKSYNNDANHGYMTPSLSKEDAEYLQLFEEEIEKWLKHHD